MDIDEIRRSLNQVDEAERSKTAGEVIYSLIAPLHDMEASDKKRALNNLKIAATIKDEFEVLIDASIISRLRQFCDRASFYYKLPPEGFALIKFLLISGEKKLNDFLISETAKAKLTGFDYIGEVNTLMQKWGEPLSKSKFDPFRPETWKPQ